VCIFCDIVRGDLAAEVVLEDDATIAFLDHRPLFPGHTLLVPREHHETLIDLPNELIEPLFANAQLLAGAIQTAMEAQGTFVAMNNKISQSVPHLHVHVVPRRRKDGLRGFFWPRTKYRNEDDMRSAGDLVRAAVADRRGEG
jgi:histidine triad (HIT) family protein